MGGQSNLESHCLGHHIWDCLHLQEPPWEQHSVGAIIFNYLVQIQYNVEPKICLKFLEWFGEITTVEIDRQIIKNFPNPRETQTMGTLIQNNQPNCHCYPNQFVESI